VTELSRASEAAPVGRAFFGGRNARRGLGGAGQRFRQAAAGRRRVSRMAPARATARTSEKGANETHASTTDPDCRLYARREAKLGSMGHVPMENRCRGRQGRPTARPSATPHAESQAPSVIASRLAPARPADTKDHDPCRCRTAWRASPTKTGGEAQASPGMRARRSAAR
jgi:hypothetical protein